MAIIVNWASYTEKQKKAIAHYIQHGKKFEAYKHAYEQHGTDRSFRRACYTFWKTPRVESIVKQVQEEAIKRARIKIEEIVEGHIDDIIASEEEAFLLSVDAMWVLKRVALLADFNIKKFIVVEDGNAFYDFSEASDDDWYCISEYTVESIEKGQGDNKWPVEKVKLKAHDKIRALELVGKHKEVQAFKEEMDVNTKLEVVEIRRFAEAVADAVKQPKETPSESDEDTDTE